VRTFLVEHYQPRVGAPPLPHAAGRARAAAERLSRQGRSVRLLYSIYIPEDESWFLVYEGVSPEAVIEAARAAAIPIERVVEALQVSPIGATDGTDDRNPAPTHPSSEPDDDRMEILCET
jgi:hypothetical protein